MELDGQTRQVLGWYVWLLLPLAGVTVLAAYRKAYPTRRLAWLATAPLILSVTLVAAVPALPTGASASWGGWSALAWLLVLVLVVDLLVMVIAALDLASADPGSTLQVEREITAVQSLGQKTTATLHVANVGQRPRTVRIRDDVPFACQAEPADFRMLLPAYHRATFQYDLRPMARGRYLLEYVYLAILSWMGLWQVFLRRPAPQELKVYPDMRQLQEYMLLARTNRLSLMGLRKSRRVGQDHDFERLREFTRDDNYKLIDWRSTARRHRLMVKDFQATRSQRLILMLDCGRMMTNDSSGQTLFDHSINANLMLAHVALSQGDAVGILVFSDRVHSYVPPRSGLGQMNRILHILFDRFPQMVESCYDEAFLYLSSHCQRRSLVVLTSNVIDEINGNQIQGYLGAMTGKHLPLGVLLRDRQVYQHLKDPQPEGDALFRAAAAADIVQWRQQVLASLRRRGVLVLDVFPEQITAPLINRYLEAKARHLL